ncbi:MAG: hypothetical protein QXE31_02100 [Candidatus Woesearchaeota archaeon]
MKELGYKLLTYLSVVFVFLIAFFYANAIEVPMGAQTVTEGYESTINNSNYPPASIQAYAGNISQLTIFGRSQTKHWQGYYGEVSGVIVLDDAQNWTMYDWPNPEPKGEIYATVSATTPIWNTIRCFNYSGTEAGSTNNTFYWESFYNMTFNDVDGIDETFNITQHPTFDVGEFTITENTCPSTFTHVNDQWQEQRFVEILLQDANGLLIFTTIIENKDEGINDDVVGYNGVTHDFQLLVAEDGTSRSGGARNQDTTTYYFYLDLE